MDKPMSDLDFRGMSLLFKVRDLFLRPKKILEEAGIRPGLTVLDYGCGPGSYSLAASGLVGKTGKVYGLDIHPLAVKGLKDTASRRGLENIYTIHSDCATGLDDESIDRILLFDILHDLSGPSAILKELHRVMKPEGVLLVSDHHMREEEIISRITAEGSYALSEKGRAKGKKIFKFIKAKPG